MKTSELRPWNSASHLQNEEDIALYLQVCIEEARGDTAFIAKTLGIVAKARGLSRLATNAGIEQRP